VFEIERGEILAVVADAHAFRDARSFGRSARERFKERGLADAVRARELQGCCVFLSTMLFLCTFGLCVFGSIVDVGSDEELADDFRLRGMVNGRMVLSSLRTSTLSSSISSISVAHLLRDEAHLASLLREEVRLVLIVLDLLLELRVLAVLALDARGSLLQEVVVVAEILLHLAGVHVEIEHAVGERVEEFRIMGNDEAGLLVRLSGNAVRCSMPSVSRLFVGSSRSRRSGSCMSALARSRRACWPPENDFTMRSLGACRFTTSSTASIFGSMSYTFSGSRIRRIRARCVRAARGE
jgi:hypothetical protein